MEVSTMLYLRTRKWNSLKVWNLFFVFFLSSIFTMSALKEGTCGNTAVDLGINPVPNIASNWIDDDIKWISAFLEIGKPHLAGASAIYNSPICILFDYGEINNRDVWILRFGLKHYERTRDRFYLRGPTAMMTVGPLYTKIHEKADWGFIWGVQVNYKFLPLKRLIVEPFIGGGWMHSDALIYDTTWYYTIGLNIGFRIVNPSY
jgi:hypothetical protein